MTCIHCHLTPEEHGAEGECLAAGYYGNRYDSGAAVARHPLAGILDAHQRLLDARVALDDAVRHARDAGHSWHQIGATLGTSRQAAFERFREVERAKS